MFTPVGYVSVTKLPPCTQSGCSHPAQYRTVWAGEFVSYCTEHINGIINVGRVMGFPVEATLEQYTLFPLLPSDSEPTSTDS